MGTGTTCSPPCSLWRMSSGRWSGPDATAEARRQARCSRRWARRSGRISRLPWCGYRSAYTILQQIGAGETTIAPAVAERLGWECIDRQILDREAEALARAEGVTLRTAVVPGHEVRAIIDYTLQHGFDTLLVGFHGHSAISERIRGSTTGSLVLNSPCTVVVVK